MGSTAAFVITGPVMKITNLVAVKIVLGIRKFVIYILNTILYTVTSGLLVDMFL